MKKEIKKLFLLTNTASDFFKKIGFNQINRSEADPLIQPKEEFSYLCPYSAIVMVKDLSYKSG